MIMCAMGGMPNGRDAKDEGSEALAPWQGLAATPCEWDYAPEDFDVVMARAVHDILGCLDRGIYTKSLGLYRTHLAWLIRQFDVLVAAGRDNLAIGSYYAANLLTPDLDASLIPH